MKRLKSILPVLGLACLVAPAAGATQRWRCVMVDGVPRVVARDLAAQHPGTVHACLALDATALPAFEDRAALPALGRALPRYVPRLEEMTAAAAEASPQAVAASEAPPGDLAALIGSASERHGLDAGLVAAVMHAESRFQQGARSPKGALGLMQVMPATAARYGVVTERELLDPRTNIDVGVRYLRDLQRLFRGRTDLVRAAYNAGEGAVARHGMRIPPYPETQDYVRRILARLGLPARAADAFAR